MADQMQFAVMEWPTDGNKISIHHLKNIETPKKQWNEYKKGDIGVAKYGQGDWDFVIHEVGRKFFRPKSV